MKFDFCIGNPPYQDETLGDNKGFAPPVYNKFLDAAFEIADRVEMIHPARFLFDAGSTPKDWNQRMINDPHFKVMQYVDDASTVFSNTDIKGGVAITYHDNKQDFGAIGIFTPFPELNSILKKVMSQCVNEDEYVSSIGISGYSYHFTELMYKENPTANNLMSKGHDYDLKSNCMEKLTMIFHTMKPNDKKEYVSIIGRVENERVWRYIRRDYINDVSNLDRYKLVIPKASGIGAFGEPLGPSVVAAPATGNTETFFSIGHFDNEMEAKNLHKYLKGKFARALLSVSKKTQNITPGNFRYVPLQNFTSASDIDWSAPIKAIDQQLYKKYGLSDEEISFIETHVKEMA